MHEQTCEFIPILRNMLIHSSMSHIHMEPQIHQHMCTRMNISVYTYIQMHTDNGMPAQVANMYAHRYNIKDTLHTCIHLGTHTHTNPVAKHALHYCSQGLSPPGTTHPSISHS